MTPRIAIPSPTSKDLSYNQRSLLAYVAAVRRSGGESVEIPLGSTAAEVRELARGCDGVLLPGSPADIDPRRYGAERDPACSAADPARERVDRILLEDAEGSLKPVLGICYGMQSLNVWRGGTLLQNLTPVPVNHAAGGQVAVAHSALVVRESLLGSLLRPDEAFAADSFWRLPVNTSHHQAIAVPGEGLRVVARCPDDGVIEAVELEPGDAMFHVEHNDVEHEEAHGSERQFVLGVQWHPERSYDISAASRAIFGRLVSEAASVLHRRRSSTHVHQQSKEARER